MRKHRLVRMSTRSAINSTVWRRALLYAAAATTMPRGSRAYCGLPRSFRATTPLHNKSVRNRMPSFQSSSLRRLVCSAQQSSSVSDEEVLENTLTWIRKVVIGFRFCPFAERPLLAKQLITSVVRGNDTEAIAAAVLLEMTRCAESKDTATSIVAAPECFPASFEEYLEIVQFIEDEVMTEHDLHGIVQLAPFHPLFQFQGTPDDAIENFTNRSPYPSFHILRENDVSRAVDTLTDGDASSVWKRNISFLKRLEKEIGRQQAERVLLGSRGHDHVQHIADTTEIFGKEAITNDDHVTTVVDDDDLERR